MQNNFITTIKNAASSSFAEFRYSYPWGEYYDIQNSSNIKDCLITNVPKVIVKELQKLKNKCLWQNSRPNK